MYTGLIDLLDDDTLLSGVLAHEIAHVTQRHAVENVSGVVSRVFSELTSSCYLAG